MSKAQELFDQAFDHRLDRRSRPYKQGVLDALKYRTGEVPGIGNRYTMGTIEFDAWRAGLEEGHLCWRKAGEPACP